MTLRTSNLRIGFYPFSSLLLGVGFVASTTPASPPHIEDDRAADREAIRAHIDSIFQAFIKKARRYCAPRTLKTGSAIWRFAYDDQGGRRLHGMEPVDPKSPYGMKSYRCVSLT